MTRAPRIAALFVVLSAAACGGASSPAETPASTPPTSSDPEPSAASDGDEPATDAPKEAGDEPGGAKAGGGEWEGEAEAVGKPVERTKEETRTTEIIQKVVKDNRQPVRDCYDKAQKELKTLRGTMTIKFTLDAEGNVKKAELAIERSDLKAPAVVDCALAEIKKIKFPPSSRGMDTTVNYPFDFKPK
jgi:TonB family protein